MRGMARSLVVLGVAATALLVFAQVKSGDKGANPAVVPVPQSSSWWMARHEESVRHAKLGNVDLLFVGDSITQNYEKTGPAPDEVFFPSWKEFFAPHHALNLGYSGDQTQNVLWRLQHGEVDGLTPTDVVLLIGTNNTAARPEATRPQSAVEVAAGVIAVAEELHTRLPRAKVLLLEILPSGVSAEKSAKDTAVNTAVCAHYPSSSYVRCLDLSSLFVKDGILNDALFYDPRLKTPRGPLHPDTQGQRRMAEAVSRALLGASEH